MHALNLPILIHTTPSQTTTAAEIKLYKGKMEESQLELGIWFTDSGWTRIAVVFSIQTWLGESEDSKKSGGTPGYFSVGMSRTFLLSLFSFFLYVYRLLY